MRASIEDDLPDDPDHVLISHNRRDPQVFDVYRVNVRTGAAELVAQNPGNVVGWQTDHAGKVRAAITSDGLNTTLLYRDDEAAPFRPLITTDYRVSVSPAFFTFDDRKLYALSNRGRDKLALVVIDPATPDVEQPVFEPDEVDLDAAGYSRKRKVLTVASYQTDKPRHRFSTPRPKPCTPGWRAPCPATTSRCRAGTATRTPSSWPPTTTARRGRAICTTRGATACTSWPTSIPPFPRPTWRRCGPSATRAATA